MQITTRHTVIAVVRPEGAVGARTVRSFDLMLGARDTLAEKFKRARATLQAIGYDVRRVETVTERVS